MKKILLTISLIFTASFGFFSLALADTTANAYTINGYMDCSASDRTGTFVAPSNLSVGEVSENAGWFNNPSGNITAYLESSSSLSWSLLATTSVVFPQGSYATTSMTFLPFQNLLSGHTYRLCYQAGASSVIDINGATGYNAQLNFANTGVGQMSILYPQNSTSTYIHDFSAFTFVATNTDSVAHTFNFYIAFDTSSTLQENPVIVSRNVNYSFAAGSTHYLNIPKSQILASSTQYWAMLCATTDGNPAASCAPLITFQLGATKYGQQIDTSQAGFFGASSSEPAVLYNSLPPVSNPSQYCDVQFYDPSSWACWGWLQIQKGIDQLGNYAGAGIERIASTTEDIFPLQVFFALNADFQNLQATTTDFQITLTGTGNAYKKVGGGYYNFNLLSSSTASASETATGFDWETFLATLIYALDGIAIVGTAFALLHKTSQHKK